MAREEQRVQNIPSDQEEEEEDEVEFLTDFTDKGQWDIFYAIQGRGDSYEWNGDWPKFEKLILEDLLSTELDKSPEEPVPGKEKSPAQSRILVPGCGTSRLSEHLYDNGYQNITNVDQSEVAIANMSRRYSKEKPAMKWEVMDMTDLQFEDECFDVVVDKEGLDSLMEPVLGPRFGNLYLTEVKRVLRNGGKFICITYAEPHVMDLLFNKFRIGWKMRIHFVPPGTHHPAKQSFMVVLEKENHASVFDIVSFLDGYSHESHGAKALDFYEALEKESKIRVEYFINNDVVYTLEDLILGAKGNISVLVPGRRIRLILGEPGVSNFSYYGILLDALTDSKEFIYQYSVYIVRKLTFREAFYAFEMVQWIMSEVLKSKRLFLVFLDSSNSISSLRDIQIDLAPLANQLSPAFPNFPADAMISGASGGMKQRERVDQGEARLTDLIVVEDVMYENFLAEEVEKYRCLILPKHEGMLLSEVRLSAAIESIGTEKEAKQ